MLLPMPVLTDRRAILTTESQNRRLLTADACPVVSRESFMTHKTAYLWGPLSSFSAPLAAQLLQKDWQVHVATKSAFNLFTLTPLDLRSSAQTALEKALGGHDNLRTFQDRLRFIAPEENVKSTKYDAAILCGLPPNFDEPRAPRAPWAAGELSSIAKIFKDVPTFIVSSVWAAIQSDGVVPEEVEFERRKAKSHWEGVCQQYETKLLKGLEALNSPWNLVRLPILSGSTKDGSILNFSGLSSLFQQVSQGSNGSSQGNQSLRLSYNPDSTLWFLPMDSAVYTVARLIEDEARPRICNLVPTQAMLNREWLQYLAQASGYQDVEASETDNYDLPGILRKMLKDEIHIKTRNLFEVAARYHLPATRLDVAYFEKLIQFGRKEHWGKFFDEGEPPPLEFSPHLAEKYFEQFLMLKMNHHQFKEATKGGTTIGFYLDDVDQPGWVLKSVENKPVVERVEKSDTSPRVRMYFGSDIMIKLIQNKLSFHEALLRRQVRLEGRVLDTLRVGNVFSQFLRSHPYTAPQIVEAQ